MKRSSTTTSSAARRLKFRRPASTRAVAGILIQPAGGDGFVGIQIHHPEDEASALELDVERAQQRDERRGSERHHHVVTGEEDKPQDAA